MLYAFPLGYRPDYFGHFAAGYGGSLGAMACLLAITPREHYSDDVRLYTVLSCFGCIALGAVFESTVFRIAKFDEVDFCNQSLGAVLAALATLAAFSQKKPGTLSLMLVLVIACMFLASGFRYAFQ